MKLARWVVCLAWSAVVCPAAGREGVVRLNERAGVAGEAIRLSDLLPADAPAAVRAAALSVELARSPQLGSPRILSREQIGRGLLGHADLPARFSIPEQVTIVRQGWPIRPGSVRKAVLDFAGKQDWGLGPSDSVALELSGNPQALVEDPGLAVQSADADKLRHRLRFVVRCIRPQACGGFLVSASLPADFSNGLHPRTGLGAKPKQGEILVRAGQPAVLNMRSGNMSIFLRVVCLERGSMGQTIRAREGNSHRIFRAQVVGAGVLRSRL